MDRVTRGLTLMCSLGPYDEGTLVCLLYLHQVEEYWNPEKHEFARRSWPLDCNLESVSDDSSYKPSPLSTPRSMSNVASESDMDLEAEPRHTFEVRSRPRLRSARRREIGAPWHQPNPAQDRTTVEKDVP